MINLVNNPSNGTKKVSVGQLPSDKGWYSCVARVNAIRIQVWTKPWYEGEKLFEKSIVLTSKEGDVIGTPLQAPNRLSMELNALLRPYIPHSDYVYLGGDLSRMPDKPFKQICNKILWEYLASTGMTIKTKQDTKMETKTNFKRGKRIPIEGKIPFAKNLMFLRKKAGITQKNLAATLGVGTSALGHWETTLITPSEHAAKQLAEYFKVSYEDIISKDMDDGSVDNVHKVFPSKYKRKSGPRKSRKKGRALARASSGDVEQASRMLKKTQIANFRANIKNLRLSQGKSQMDIANLAHTASSQISGLENKMPVTMDKIAMMAKLFNTTISNLTDKKLSPMPRKPGKPRGRHAPAGKAAPDATKLVRDGARKYIRKAQGVYAKSTMEDSIPKMSLVEARKLFYTKGKDDAYTVMKTVLTNIGFPKEQADRLVLHKIFAKEDAEAAILGMATAADIKLHVGDSEVMHNTYNKIIKELESRLLAVTEELENMKANEVSSHTEIVEKAVEMDVVFNVRGSDRKATLTISSDGKLAMASSM